MILDEPAGIFICYRRRDAIGSTGRLCDRLVQQFGADDVFLDVESVQPGDDFREVISDAVTSSCAMVVVIGPDWLRPPPEPTPLHSASNFVRLEIESAFAAGLRVIPVLVDGAAMPNVDRLPSAVQKLAFLHAVTLRHESWGHDSGILVDALERLRERAAKRPATSESLSLGRAGGPGRAGTTDQSVQRARSDDGGQASEAADSYLAFDRYNELLLSYVDKHYVGTTRQWIEQLGGDDPGVATEETDRPRRRFPWVSILIGVVLLTTIVVLVTTVLR
ncbi:MAG: toll/interleukin-1 receptor domain-containing protein [Actinomycetota bacterium]